MRAFDAVTLEVLWSRLQALVDEADAVLARTAFSTVVRESHDYVTVLLDAEARSIVQCSHSVPSFIGTLPITARHLLDRFGRETLGQGDALITNDPWLGTGHLPDITMLSPVMYDGRVVAFAGSIAHMTDIGGPGMSAQAKTIYEEGLTLPPLRLLSGGEFREDVLDIIRANVRVPDQVLGDLEAQATANDMIARRLRDFIDDYGLGTFVAVAEEIQARSEDGMRRAIAALPDGTYAHEAHGDGFDQDFTVAATIDVRGDTISVDFAGTSSQQQSAINVTSNYTYAFTVYALKCLLDPEMPNNHGALAPISVTAPAGSILNPTRPAPVAARSVVGHVVPHVVFAALASVLPERVAAESGSAPLWAVSFNGISDDGAPYSTVAALSGGQGARASMDGHSTLHYPSNAANTPVEVLELATPLLVEEKRLLRDSGGSGARRGGHGQRISFRNAGSARVAVSLMTGKLEHAAQGLFGGGPGRRGNVELEPPRPFNSKGNLWLEPDERLVLETPGGGGFGEEEAPR